MRVEFTPDQHALVQEAIAAVRLHHEEDAAKQALLRWKSASAGGWKYWLPLSSLRQR